MDGSALCGEIEREKRACSSSERNEPQMAKRSRLSAIPLLILLISATIAGAFAGGNHFGHELGWIPTKSVCHGTIAECLAGEEFDLGSETNRRILATSSYISYGALRRNLVPCSRRGASYYNCRAGAQANPYSRGCSAITRCRR